MTDGGGTSLTVAASETDGVRTSVVLSGRSGSWPPNDGATEAWRGRRTQARRRRCHLDTIGYSANTMDRSPPNVPRSDMADVDDDDATAVIEIRRGGIPRSLSWTVDRLIWYDRRWTPYDVVLNGVARGRLGPRGPRRMRATVQPGRISIELASIYSGLVDETAERPGGLSPTVRSWSRRLAHRPVYAASRYFSRRERRRTKMGGE